MLDLGLTLANPQASAHFLSKAFCSARVFGALLVVAGELLAAVCNRLLRSELGRVVRVDEFLNLPRSHLGCGGIVEQLENLQNLEMANSRLYHSGAR